MIRLLLIVWVAALATGCWKRDEVPQVIDRIAFQHVGGTLFASPDLLTMKEVHLDGGASKLLGREVIIEGRMAEVGQHQTYFVLADDTARLLVVLTNLDADAIGLLATKPAGPVRVLGTVEAGKKGLPYLMARSITQVPAAAASAPGKV